MRTPLFQRGIHIDGQMVGDKVGSKQLLQGVVNSAMEPERCASAVGDFEWDSTAAALHLVFLEVFLVGTTAEFYIS